jgi:hypothetical protein
VRDKFEMPLSARRGEDCTRTCEVRDKFARPHREPNPPATTSGGWGLGLSTRTFTFLYRKRFKFEFESGARLPLGCRGDLTPDATRAGCVYRTPLRPPAWSMGPHHP